MKNWILGGAAAFAAALCSAVAVAQIPTSTREIIRSNTPPPPSEVALADEVLRETVDCIIERQGPRTRNLLETIPGTRAEGAILSSFQSRLDYCYDSLRAGGRAITLTNNLLRGFIAEAHYASDFPAGIAPAEAAAPELTAAWARPRPEDGRAPQLEMLHAMARCVTVRQPATVAAMLRAEPFSVEERATIGALAPDLSACLDSGVEFTASRQSLRGLLAEAALHYARARSEGFARAGGAAESE